MRPNLLFVFADQLRADAMGYAGDPNAITPNLDAFARQSINLTHAVAGHPVCSPYRASLLTGCYPLTHGVFINDVPIRPRLSGMGEAFAAGGYDTAYIGKWHVDGHGRAHFIPRERRLGFDYWRVLECTHDYNHSAYFGDEPVKHFWAGYDAEAQTADAERYLRERPENAAKPFAMVLSWGPPHNPYETAPARWAERFDPAKIQLRPNVPPAAAEQARKELAGYYAHLAALDECFGRLLATLAETRLDRNTIVVFTSDHGDMLGSQGQWRKQRPWDESIRVPFLLRDPRLPARADDLLINTPDILPTLLGLCGLAIPGTVEGTDYAPVLRGEPASPGPARPAAALIACVHPFAEFSRHIGGREYRGVRTIRHTFVRDRSGPWLLYDNDADPYQLQNRVDDTAYSAARQEVDGLLHAMLAQRGDEFLAGEDYLARWGYKVDAQGAAPTAD